MQGLDGPAINGPRSVVPRDEVAEADPGPTSAVSPPAVPGQPQEMAPVSAPETAAWQRAWSGWDCALSTIILLGLACLFLGRKPTA